MTILMSPTADYGCSPMDFVRDSAALLVVEMPAYQRDDGWLISCGAMSEQTAGRQVMPFTPLFDALR
jgi:hypothetical protein